MIRSRAKKWKTRQLLLLIDGMLAYDTLGCMTARVWLGWLRPHVKRIETHVPWLDSINSGHLLLPCSLSGSLKGMVDRGVVLCSCSECQGGSFWVSPSLWLPAVFHRTISVSCYVYPQVLELQRRLAHNVPKAPNFQAAIVRKVSNPFSFTNAIAQKECLEFALASGMLRQERLQRLSSHLPCA